MQKNLYRLLLVAMLALAVAVSIAAAQGGGRGGGGRGGGGIPALPITSAAFADGTDIPAKYDGGNMAVSPDLSWTPPMGAPIASYVLFLHDVDAGSPATTMATDITHWVIWNIPSTTTKLPEHVPAGATLADGSHQANNIFGQPQYGGPQPPAGAPYHHYIFQLYALNAMLDLPATATRADVEKALDGKIVARGAYTGKVKGN